MEYLGPKTPDAALATQGDLNATPRMIVRPHFKVSATGNDYIKLSGGIWFIDGIGIVYNNSTIDYQFTSLAASTWSYLYIDHSTLTGPGAITASNLTDSTTAWSVDYAKNAHTNGNDVGIFAVYGAGTTDYHDFLHGGGDTVTFLAIKTILNNSTATSFQSWSFCAPAESLRALIKIHRDTSGTTTLSHNSSTTWTSVLYDNAQVFFWLDHDGSFYSKTNSGQYDVHQLGFRLPAFM